MSGGKSGTASAPVSRGSSPSARAASSASEKGDDVAMTPPHDAATNPVKPSVSANPATFLMARRYHGLVGPRRHGIAAALVCVVVPLGSRFFGPSPGYTMFAGYTDFRMELRVFDGDRPRAVPPSALAPYARGYLAALLTLGDRGGRVRSVGALRAHLADVARLGCDVLGATRVEVVLDERDDAGDVRHDSAEQSCAP